MAKDTKDTIAKAFLILLAKQEPMTVVNLSKFSGVTRPAIHTNFGKDCFQGISDYIFLGISNDIKEALSIHSTDELPPEIFADIVFPKLYEHRDALRILYDPQNSNFKYNFVFFETMMSQFFPWAKPRFERLLKASPLPPTITAQDLFDYWMRWLISIIILWMTSDIPDDPKVFKEKFIYLINTSFKELIYPEF